MKDEITPLKLLEKIKSFRTFDQKFIDILKKSDNSNFQEYKKIDLKYIDDAVKEEYVINLFLDIHQGNLESKKLIAYKEKLILSNAYNIFREHLINKNEPISFYDDIFKKILE